MVSHGGIGAFFQDRPDLFSLRMRAVQAAERIDLDDTVVVNKQNTAVLSNRTGGEDFIDIIGISVSHIGR